MKKLTNVQKILKALKSGPKTQADLVRETKVKNVYQIIADLKKRKLVFMDTGKYACISCKYPIAVDETDRVSAEQMKAVLPKPHVTAKVQNERKAMREQDLLHIEISELKNQIADLEEQLQDMSVKYYDAVAVINYLEKFFNYRIKE
jgi:hypothetical protein